MLADYLNYNGNDEELDMLTNVDKGTVHASAGQDAMPENIKTNKADRKDLARLAGSQSRKDNLKVSHTKTYLTDATEPTNDTPHFNK